VSDNPKQFKSALKNNLYVHSFCYVEEHFHVNRWYTKLNQLYCNSYYCMYI